MATDVKNGSGGNTGSAQNGKITVKSNRNEHQFQNPPGGVITFSIAGFDLGGSPNGTDLADRFDEPRYYQGDAIT